MRKNLIRPWNEREAGSQCSAHTNDWEAVLGFWQESTVEGKNIHETRIWRFGIGTRLDAFLLLNAWYVSRLQERMKRAWIQKNQVFIVFALLVYSREIYPTVPITFCRLRKLPLRTLMCWVLASLLCSFVPKAILMCSENAVCYDPSTRTVFAARSDILTLADSSSAYIFSSPHRRSQLSL